MFKSGIIYQIVPDRFAIGQGVTLADKLRRGLYTADTIPMRWEEDPRLEGRRSVQHYGGDLFGIAERVDYIESLGAGAVYITPFHPAPSYHRYDATDYRAVAPELGGMEGFRALRDALHSRGIALIMDLVLNHVSDNHPWFREAAGERESPRRDWFYLNDDDTYAAWWGNPRLPEFNLENDALVRELIDGPQSILGFWIDQGVDGFRLDCANDLGTAFSARVRDAARKLKPDVYISGEVFHYAADWMGALDGVQCYYYTTSILRMLHGDITSRQFGMNVSRLYAEGALPGGIHGSWNMISSHDFPRPLTTLNGDVRQLFLALLLQFTLPGLVMIYYGDEIGMSGGMDPMNRGPMRWDESSWNHEINHLYRQLISLRGSRNEFQGGSFVDLSEWLDNGVAGYVRLGAADPREYSIVFVNPTHDYKRFTVYVSIPHMFSDMELEDVFSGARVRSMAGALQIELAPVSGALYVPDYDCKKQYRFSKRL
jgi:glycosidase